MQVHETIEGFRKALDAERAAGRVVGLVPTMGYLHDGHASLMRRAAERVRRRGGDGLREPAAVRGQRGPVHLSPRPRGRRPPGDGVGRLAPVRTGGGGDVPVGPRRRVDERPRRRSERGARGRVEADALRRRRHRRRQALQHRRRLPRLLRREGLAAAARRPAARARPVVPGGDRRLPDRAGGRRSGHVESQRPPHPGTANGVHRVAPRAARRSCCLRRSRRRHGGGRRHRTPRHPRLRRRPRRTAPHRRPLRVRPPHRQHGDYH